MEKTFLFKVEDFKKYENGDYNVFIYRTKTNQQIKIGNHEKADKLILSNNPDIIEITNNSKHKTLVQEFQKLEVSRDLIKLATQHKNVESLESYELPRE
ncbi:hypothetical protein C1645_825481 [Glomus cerebriforme]|uniref:Uncharacterized protein n=1 Tax=Glomus cerebriforme TaxID=658196 RepID=A0A397SS90_9GLOM|nr:hypothetical protein C1645_825481 [Glomus cerebriforme]